MPGTYKSRDGKLMIGIHTRMREETHGLLRHAAKVNGNSLNGEIVARLERTLVDDQRPNIVDILQKIDAIMASLNINLARNP